MRHWTCTRLVVAAGLAMVSLAASAWVDPQQVVITKASDSRTLTVRFSGAKATLVELRINGVAAGTRAITTGQTSGETNFALDTSKLTNGENTVEIRLFDVDGKVVGSEKTTVIIDRTSDGPVFLSKPQSGSTVQGMVEIAVGFKYELKNAYVSFFLDDEFKALKNYAPYTFLWDTSKGTNGWHEVEAWVVDENSTTFRTQRMRVFVNNPGGNTNRESTPGTVEPRETVVPVKPAVPKTLTPKPANLVGKPAVLALETSENRFVPVVSKPSGTKAAQFESGYMTSQRVMKPTGQRIAGQKPTKGNVTEPKVSVTKSTVKSNTVKPVIEVKPSGAELTALATKPVAKPTIAKTKGTLPMVGVAKISLKPKPATTPKIPNIGYFPIYLDGEPVKFDVMPRVDDGVALTPFRHLFEHAGGKVGWQNETKTVEARGMGSEVKFQIGQDIASINGNIVGLERKSFLEQGRAIVPLSFMEKLLDVNVAYDPATKHVLVTKAKH